MTQITQISTMIIAAKAASDTAITITVRLPCCSATAVHTAIMANARTHSATVNILIAKMNFKISIIY